MSEKKSVSQAMREGAARTGYISGFLIDPMSMETGHVTQSCALGAMLVGAGFTPAQIYSDTPCEAYPELAKMATCPVCGTRDSRADIIAHLNNDPSDPWAMDGCHGWAREDIAWWYEQTFEQAQTQEVVGCPGEAVLSIL